MGKGGNQQPAISASEHIAKEDGENIDAKRAGNYAWDGTNWQRISRELASSVDYDFTDVQQTSATVETYVFKLGGSGGTTVQTIVVTYTSSAKTDVDTVAWS